MVKFSIAKNIQKQKCAKYEKLYIFVKVKVYVKYAKIFSKFSKPKFVFKENLKFLNSL